MKRHGFPICLIVMLSLALYANTLKNGFLLDDYDTVVNNELIKDFHNLPKLFERDYFKLSGEMSYRPFVTFTYFIDYRLYGLKPWGYHLTNTLLHAVNGILLYAFMTLLLQPSSIRAQQPKFPTVFSNRPLLISLLLAAHPVLTEAVNGISFREDLLTFLFYIATLTIYIAMRNDRFRKATGIYLLSCFLYFLALFSKEMAVTLPLVIICYEWVYSDKKNLYSLFNLYNMGYIAVTLIYIYIRFYRFYNPDPVLTILTPPWDINERLFTMPWLFFNHLKVTIFPIDLSTDHIINPIKLVTSSTFIISTIAITLLLIITFTIKNKKEIVFGILFFFVSLIPVYNVIPIVIPFAERYLYLPIFGLAIVTASMSRFILISQSSKNRNLFTLIVSLFILSLYSFAVVKRNMVWQDDYSFWSDTVRKAQKSARAHHNLGTVYADRRELDKAIQEFRIALKLNPFDPRYHSNLGIAYADKGILGDALREFQNVVSIIPNDPLSRYNLGVTYLKTGLLDKAKQEFELALKLNPDYIQAQQALKSID